MAVYENDDEYKWHFDIIERSMLSERESEEEGRREISITKKREKVV
jgi:hypothetical protein